MESGGGIGFISNLPTNLPLEFMSHIPFGEEGEAGGANLPEPQPMPKFMYEQGSSRPSHRSPTRQPQGKWVE